MGFFLITLSSIFAAAYNLCMRNSVQRFQNAHGFLMIELWMASIFSAMMHPLRQGSFFGTQEVLFIGFLVGLIFGTMLHFLGKAMECGPAGLTIAGLNSSNVLPTIILWSVFGPQLGFSYNIYHFVGSLLVVLGIFWATWELSHKTCCKSWSIYAFSAIACHVFFFVCMEWRSWMIRYPDSVTQFRLLSQKSAANPWFIPAMYLGAASLHTAFFFQKEQRLPQRKESYLGIVGGVFNAFYAFFLVWSSEAASPMEHAMLFPLFSVMTIFLCNIWGKCLYQETVHWKACNISFLGVFLGTVDWEMVSFYWK